MFKQVVAGFLIGSLSIWISVLLLITSPSALLFGSGSPSILSLITIIPLFGGIIGFVVLKRSWKGFLFGALLGIFLNSIPLLLSFVIYHNLWAIAVDYGYLAPPLLSGLIG